MLLLKSPDGRTPATEDIWTRFEVQGSCIVHTHDPLPISAVHGGCVRKGCRPSRRGLTRLKTSR